MCSSSKAKRDMVCTIPYLLSFSCTSSYYAWHIILWGMWLSSRWMHLVELSKTEWRIYRLAQGFPHPWSFWFFAALLLVTNSMEPRIPSWLCCIIELYCHRRQNDKIRVENRIAHFFGTPASQSVGIIDPTPIQSSHTHTSYLLMHKFLLAEDTRSMCNALGWRT